MRIEVECCEAADLTSLVTRPSRQKTQGSQGSILTNKLPEAVWGFRAITGDAPIEETIMAENVYKIIELVGTSTESWEKAAAAAIARASKTLRDLRVAEVSELDLQLNDGKVEAYRAKVKVSFKYESES